jgi:hypothetical protein
MIEFEIPNGLNFNFIEKISLSFFSLKRYFIISDIIKEYTLYCNDLPLEIIDYFLLYYSIQDYTRHKCDKYNLRFNLINSSNPLQMVENIKFKINFYLLQPVINLTVHIKSGNSIKTINLN